ncbi:MAG: peptidase S9, partial [Bacteroidota bacterium]
MPIFLTPRLWAINVFLLTVVSMPAAMPVATAQTSAPTERMTPERLWAIDRVGGSTLSPDGTQLAYTVSTPDVSANTMTTAVWTVGTAPGAEPMRHAEGRGPMWLPSGRLVHVAPDGQRMVAGDGRTVITGIPEDAANVEIAPTGDYVSFTRNVRLVPAPTEEYPDLPETTVRIHDDLLVRHWTQWTDGTYSHLFVAPLDPATLTVGEATDAMPGQQIHTPLRPFGGAEQITWHPDGRRIAYTARPFDGLEAATSTNADIFLYDVRLGETTNLTDFNPGYDIEPAFSPDGSQVAWSSMARDGYESDRNRIFVMDLATGERRELTEGFDGNAYHPAWLPDGETILFTTSTEGTTQLYRIAVADGTRSPVTEGVHNITSVSISGTAADPVVVVGRQSMIEPTDLHRVDLGTGALTRLTAAGIESTEGLDVPTVHRRDVPTTDGQSMLVWEIRPPGFEPNLQYPAILYMQGGPQSALTQFFSYRWNFHALAAQGYVVVAPNRRG